MKKDHRSLFIFPSLFLLPILALNICGCACQNSTTAAITEEPVISAQAATIPSGTEISFASLDLDALTEHLVTADPATVTLAKHIVAPADTSLEETKHPTTSKGSGTVTKADFFADTLFIGDSRTVGLRDYAELDTATFFAYSGLSSFSAFKKSLDMDGTGKITLEELLTTRQFNKIYVMLGINELGYPFSSIVSKYTQMTEQIRQLHPHAVIFLCANLRVVADGKETRDYIANDTINQLNAHIASLADNQTTFYIDANPLFDDGNGALDPQYCTDDLHPYGKYYYQWGEWLYQTGIPSPQ